MLTNCSQHENPLAPRSAWWCRTARANPARSIRDRICAKQLATATIQYLRLVGDTAWQRRRWVWMNSPSYSQAGGILRTYFGQECSRPLCFDELGSPPYGTPVESTSRS